MKTCQHVFEVRTQGRGMTDITGRVADSVASGDVMMGICHVFLHHTSASLLLCENNDPDVQGDLERFFSRMIPDGDAIYQHVAEGPDDMSAHVRSVLTTNALALPITAGRLALGRWQGIYLWEHRTSPAAERRVTVTVQG